MAITTTKASGLRGPQRASVPPRERHLRVVPPLGEAMEPPAVMTVPAVTTVARGPSVATAPVSWGEEEGARRSLRVRLDLDGLRLTVRGRVVVALAALMMVAPLVWGATAVASVPQPSVEVRVDERDVALRSG